MFLPIPLKLLRSGASETIPIPNLVVIVVNVVVFAFGWGRAVGPETGALSTILYGFSHGSVLHLLLNLGPLWAFGNPVNHRLGNGLYIAVYMGSVLAVGLFARAFLPGDLLGASGALFAVMTIAVVLMPSMELKFGYLALFPVTLLLKLWQLPKTRRDWFIYWGYFSLPALWTLLLIPPITILVSVLGWINDGWSWVPAGHLIGVVCGLVVGLLHPSRRRAGR